MKFTFQKERILDGLNKAGSIIPAKAGMAYLRSIWLQAQNGSLSLMATDANIEFTGTYPAEVEEPGLAGVQGRAFIDLARKLPNGPINAYIDKKGDNLVLEQGRRSYKLALAVKDWFQEFSPFPQDGPVMWTGDIFAKYMDRVAFCIGDDDLQDALGCLCLKPRENGRIDICGLNGHQFALVAFNYPELCDKLPKQGLLIQKKYLTDIKKWLAPDELEINITDKRVFLRRLEGAELLSFPRALHDYPDYNLFMAKVESPDVSRLALPCKEAMDAMSRIQIFNTESQRCVFMDIKPNEVELSAQGSDVGSARESLAAESSGDLRRIAFPTKNLMEIFGHFSSEKLEMRMTGDEGPCGISGPDDMGYIVIIMPMKAQTPSYYEDEEEESL